MTSGADAGPDRGLESTSGFAADLLQGRTAVVTAAAGSIGGATAHLLATHGADVVCADIDGDRLHALARRIEQDGGRPPRLVVADLTSRHGIEALRLEAEATGHVVDILVNGLGEHLASAGRFEDSDEDEWQRLYEVNLLHVFRACHAFLPGMLSNGWGRIVNFSSVEGIRSAPALAVYAAFKSAVDGFTKSLAVDVAGAGVVVTSVAVDKTRAYQTGRYDLPEEYARLVPTWVPAGRYGEAEDVARIVLFLASPLNTWIVGSTVVADGGTLAAGGWFRTPRRWTNQPLLAQYLEDPSLNDARPPAVQ